MSGPIVRRYGFPNFDRIFGKKELEHGVDEAEPPAPTESPSANPNQTTPEPPRKADAETKSGARSAPEGGG